MKKIKWSKRQCQAIRKVIRHYEEILKDVKCEYYCSFCRMYSCGFPQSKCPNAVLHRDCGGGKVTVSYNNLIVAKGIYLSDPYNETYKINLRDAIQNRIRYWEKELKRGEV